jgi:hypothetical protein
VWTLACAAVVGLAGYAYVSTYYRTPAITSDVLQACTVREIHARVEPASRRSQAWSPTSTGPRYHVEAVILAELDDGTFVCPVWITTGARFGPLMNVYTVYEWSQVSTVWALSDSSQLVSFPVLEQCQRYYLILREPDSGTGRQTPSSTFGVQEVLPHQVDSGKLTIREVSELPSMDTHKFYEQLTRAHRKAVAARKEIRHRET